MNDDKPVAIDASSVPLRRGSNYPHPFSEPCAGRRKYALGDAFGLTDYGVNRVTLPPGTWSAQRHWHSDEDELVYILVGNPTLVTDAGRTRLEPGMCAGFAAGVPNGHHLVNDTERSVVYLEVGSRRRGEDVDYPDIDMQIKGRGLGGGYLHKDGTPYA